MVGEYAPRFDVRRAAGALAALLRDPDDLPQVFALISALSGTAPHRLLRAFRRDAGGARILRERPDILPRLANRAALRALPEGSLGRAYLAFVEAEGITPQGIRDASIEGSVGGARPDEFLYLHRRMRDTHDLWHAVTGYQGDVLGELGLLAFLLAQHWNTGIALILAAATLKGMARGEGTAVIRDGFARGRRAAWLPPQDWEALLARPLDEVRAALRLGAPPAYTPVRTGELRARRVIAAA